MTEVKCLYGSSTATPCPRPGTVPFREDDPAGPKECEVHAALEPLKDEVTDLSVAFELFDEWEEEAREIDNRPLLEFLKRARTEFREREEFLKEHHKAISTAGS